MAINLARLELIRSSPTIMSKVARLRASPTYETYFSPEQKGFFDLILGEQSAPINKYAGPSLSERLVPAWLQEPGKFAPTETTIYGTVARPGAGLRNVLNRVISDVQTSRQTPQFTAGSPLEFFGRGLAQDVGALGESLQRNLPVSPLEPFINVGPRSAFTQGLTSPGNVPYRTEVSSAMQPTASTPLEYGAKQALLFLNDIRNLAIDTGVDPISYLGMPRPRLRAAPKAAPLSSAAMREVLRRDIATIRPRPEQLEFDFTKPAVPQPEEQLLFDFAQPGQPALPDESAAYQAKLRQMRPFGNQPVPRLLSPAEQIPLHPAKEAKPLAAVVNAEARIAQIDQQLGKKYQFKNTKDAEIYGEALRDKPKLIADLEKQAVLAQEKADLLRLLERDSEGYAFSTGQKQFINEALSKARAPIMPPKVAPVTPPKVAPIQNPLVAAAEQMTKEPPIVVGAEKIKVKKAPKAKAGFLTALEKNNVKNLYESVEQEIKQRHGEVTEDTFERISQKAGEYDDEFLKKHPEISPDTNITVLHDPIIGEDFAVVDEDSGKIIEVFNKKLGLKASLPIKPPALKATLPIAEPEAKPLLPAAVSPFDQVKADIESGAFEQRITVEPKRTPLSVQLENQLRKRAAKQGNTYEEQIVAQRADAVRRLQAGDLPPDMRKAYQNMVRELDKLSGRTPETVVAAPKAKPKPKVKAVPVGEEDAAFEEYLAQLKPAKGKPTLPGQEAPELPAPVKPKAATPTRPVEEMTAGEISTELNTVRKQRSALLERGERAGLTGANKKAISEEVKQLKAREDELTQAQIFGAKPSKGKPRNILGEERGSIETGLGGGAEDDIEFIRANLPKLTQLAAQRKMSVRGYLESLTNDAGERLISDAVIQSVVPSTEKLGNIQLRKFPEESAQFEKAAETASILKSKTVIGRKERLANVPSAKLDELTTDILSLNDDEIAAIGDNAIIAVKQILAMSKARGKDIAPVMDDVIKNLRSYQRIGSLGGRILESRKKPPDLNEALGILREQLATAKGAEKARLQEGIDLIELMEKEPKSADMWDVLIEYSNANLLSSTDTMLRNFFGNAQLSVLKTINRFTQGALTKLFQAANVGLGAVSGGKAKIPLAQESFLREGVEEIKSLSSTIGRATRYAGFYLRHEDDLTVLRDLNARIQKLEQTHPVLSAEKKARARQLRELNRDIAYILNKRNVTKIDDITVRPRAITGELAKKLGASEGVQKAVDIAGKIIRLPYRPIKAGDEFFGLLSSDSTRAALAVRNLLKQGMEHPSNRQVLKEMQKLPSEQLREAEADRLEYTLLRQLGPTGKQFVDLMNKFKVSRLFIRFFNTQVNLGKLFVDHSLLGIGNVIAESRKAGGLDLKQLAKVVNGTLGTAGIYLWMKNNDVDIRASAKDRAQREAWNKQGYPENSIRFKDGKTVSFTNNAPASYFFATLAALGEFEKSKQRGMPTPQNINDTIGRFTKSILSESYFDTPRQLVNLFEDLKTPKTIYDNEGNVVSVPTPISRYFDRWAVSGSVPFSSLLRKTTRAGIPGVLEGDVTVRNPQNIREEFKATLPGLSRTVRPRLNWDGSEQRRSEEGFLPIPFGRAPLRITKQTTNVLDNEMDRLRLYPEPYGPAAKNVSLTQDERDDLTKKYGPRLRSVLEKVVTSEAYTSLPDVQRDKALRAFIKAASNVGYTEGFFRALARYKQTHEGRKAVEYYFFKGLSPRQQEETVFPPR